MVRSTPVEYLDFDWLDWLTLAAKLKADWLNCYFPNAGYDLGHPDSVISKHSAFYPNPGMGTPEILFKTWCLVTLKYVDPYNYSRWGGVEVYKKNSLTVRIVWKHILSRVRVSVRASNFLYAKNIQNQVNRVVSACVYFNDPATGYECQRSRPSRLGANE